MKRDEWEFEYTGKQLADAAHEQAEFRASRVKVWKEKQEEVEKEIREKGVTIHEKVVDRMAGTTLSNSGKYSGYDTLGVGPSVQVDVNLSKDLAECYGKVKEHERLEKEYRRWENVMRAHESKTYQLNSDDWSFFFGK